MTDVQVAFAQETFVGPSGEQYTLQPPNYETIRDFTNYLEKLAIEFVIRNRVNYGRDFKEARAELATKAAQGEFEWGGKAFEEAMNCDDRCFELALLTLRQAHPKITRDELRALWTIPDLVVNEKGEHVEGIRGVNVVLGIIRLAFRKNLPRPSQETGKNGELGQTLKSSQPLRNTATATATS